MYVNIVFTTYDLIFHHASVLTSDQNKGGIYMHIELSVFTKHTFQQCSSVVVDIKCKSPQKVIELLQSTLAVWYNATGIKKRFQVKSACRDGIPITATILCHFSKHALWGYSCYVAIAIFVVFQKCF